jgi:hypothetical protein
MRSATKCMIIAVALGGWGLEAAPGARPVPGSRNDHALTAARESGRTYLAGRELQIDLDFPSGRSRKGELIVLFEPSTGLFLRILHWANDYPKTPWTDMDAQWQFGVAAGRLVIVTFAEGVGIVQSTEKASSIDDAETQSLNWAQGHIADLEARSSGGNIFLAVGKFEFPEGFLRLRHDPLGLRIKLVDMVWQGQGWDLTIENMDTHRRAKLLVTQHGNTWTRSLVRPMPAQI